MSFNPFGSGDEEEETHLRSSNTRNRTVVHEKPLSAFISHVPDALCVPTADFNPFQFWNVPSEEIEKWGEQINDAIATAVNRHHRGFNQATTEFDEILSAFHDSEMKFKRLSTNLSEARKLLHQSRGENGKTAAIAKQWKAFESYKKKLKELDKIEYILEIPQIFDKYLTKKQFIHAAVLLNDALTLSYTHKASVEVGKQLQSSGNIILNKKNDLEKLLRQQLHQQIYFKTNSLRSNLLRPPKRNPNKNILNLLNFQKEIMMMDEDEEKKTESETLPKSDSLTVRKPHFKADPSVHYDTLASLNQNTQSIGIGSSAAVTKKKHKNVLTSTSQPTSLQDPHKIIVPTYKSFRNLDDVKDGDSDHKSIIGNVQHLLVAETTDEYLKLASNNNNYADDEQPLFLTICVTAVEKLGRSVALKTNLFKSLDIELKEIIDREIYEVCNSYQQNMIQSNQMANGIEPEEQSLMLLSAIQNVFKILMRVLANHKSVIHVFKQSETAHNYMRLQSYTIDSVWNAMQKAILHGLLYKYLDKHLLERIKSKVRVTKANHAEHDRDKDSAVDFLLGTVQEYEPESDDNILKVRSVSPSPAAPDNRRSSDNNPKSFGARLKDSKFFKRRRTTAEDPMEHADEVKDNKNGGGDDNGSRDLFASNAISNKYHMLAMDGLTFSFADSNIGSIVLDNEYGGGGVSNHHKTMPSEFAAPGTNKKRRLSIGSANAFTATQGAAGRVRGATHLNAFASKGKLERQNSRSHALTIAAAMGKTDKNSKDNKAKSKNKSGKGKDARGPRGVGGRRRKELALIGSSPYHVTKLYKPIIHFVETAEWKILCVPEHDVKVEAEYDLRDFLSEFVTDRFIPHMQGEAYFQMERVLLDNQPMDQIRITDEPLLLLKSSYGIFDLIRTLFEYYVVLPGFDSAQFVDMIQVILSKVRDTYQQAMDEICEILISRDLIHNKNNDNNDGYVNRLSAYNLRKSFEGSQENFNDPYKDKYDRRAYEKIDTETKTVDQYSYSVIAEKHKHIDTKDLSLFLKVINPDDAASFNYNFNTEYYSKLALMSTGLFWLSNKITSELITPLMAKEQTRRLTKSSKAKSKAKHSSLSAICDFLSSTFEPRSERCLSVIRMELRSQAVCLLKNISRNNYWMPDDSIINKPQEFIITLNKLLVSCEAKLNGCLQPKLIKYLFEELAYFICDIIIYQIPLVKSGKINHVGYKQLYKNTFSLQQNLTTITQKGMEKCFDRAQKYLKLSQKTPQDIKKIHDIKNKKYGTDKEKYAAYNFTKDQYDAISTVAKLSNAHRK